MSQKSPSHNKRAPVKIRTRQTWPRSPKEWCCCCFFTGTATMCVTNLSVTLRSSGGTLRGSLTKDGEYWLLNSPPSAVTFKVTWTAVTVAFRLRLELIFAPLSTADTQYHWSTERGNVPLYTHGPSERPTQRTERTNGRRRSSRHA